MNVKRGHADSVAERHRRSVAAAKASIRQDPEGWVRAARNVWATLGLRPLYVSEQEQNKRGDRP